MIEIRLTKSVQYGQSYIVVSAMQWQCLYAARSSNVT